jgi:hypothetical protein
MNQQSTINNQNQSKHRGPKAGYRCKATNRTLPQEKKGKNHSQIDNDQGNTSLVHSQEKSWASSRNSAQTPMSRFFSARGTQLTTVSAAFALPVWLYEHN